MSYPKSSDVAKIGADQRSWAIRNGLPINDRSTGLSDMGTALFSPLTEAITEQLGAAPGGELRRMHSFRSSTALAVNVFAPWGGDASGIAHLLGGRGRYGPASFEARFSTGVSYPYLDVILPNDDLPIAVESKFAEPYDDTVRSSFKQAYFDHAGLWDDVPELEELALEITRQDVVFERLDAAQLIKHSLGLANSYGQPGFRLLYLWYRVPGAKADQHEVEIEHFTQAVGDSVNFLALSYQDLFSLLEHEEEPMDGYLSYLRDRYFREP